MNTSGCRHMGCSVRCRQLYIAESKLIWMKTNRMLTISCNYGNNWWKQKGLQSANSLHGNGGRGWRVIMVLWCWESSLHRGAQQDPCTTAAYFFPILRPRWELSGDRFHALDNVLRHAMAAALCKGLMCCVMQHGQDTRLIHCGGSRAFLLMSTGSGSDFISNGLWTCLAGSAVAEKLRWLATVLQAIL